MAYFTINYVCLYETIFGHKIKVRVVCVHVRHCCMSGVCAHVCVCDLCRYLCVLL